MRTSDETRVASFTVIAKEDEVEQEESGETVSESPATENTES
jgi:hypothetical protein